MSRSREEVLQQLIAWADTQPLVRAVILTSSQAGDGSKVDRLSDYDVILFVTDTSPFVTDESWICSFGTPVVMFRWISGEEGPMTQHTRLVNYADMVRIDFNLSPVAVLRQMLEAPSCPKELDLGYRVLVDKDNLTRTLPLPTNQAYLPTVPTQNDFRELIEEFWWDATYVPKYLWRGELFTARITHEDLRFRHLFQMLDWWLGCKYDWSVGSGRAGRYLQQLLPSDMWVALGETCAGADIPDNWRAFWRMLDLFRDISHQVAAQLGFAYPDDLDTQVTAYLRKVSTMEREEARYGEVFKA